MRTHQHFTRAELKAAYESEAQLVGGVARFRTSLPADVYESVIDAFEFMLVQGIPLPPAMQRYLARRRATVEDEAEGRSC